MNEDEAVLNEDEVVLLVASSGTDGEETQHHQSDGRNNNQLKKIIFLLLSYLLISILCFRLGAIVVTNNKQNNVGEYNQTTLPNTTSSKEENPNDHLLLDTYTYSNCPFTMTKFSQFEMAKKGNFKSKEDRRINSMKRAKMALDFSNDAHAYERVVKALEKYAFNRTIILDGDSLSRQLFISLSCLAWTAGYVTDFDLKATTLEGDTNTILKNSEVHSSSKFFGKASVKLRGGGAIYYVGNIAGAGKDLDMYQDHLMESCKSRKRIFQARNTYDLKNLKSLSESDIVVLAAGHQKDRELALSNYKEFLECVQLNQEDYPNDFKDWPTFLYQSMSNENFWTIDGLIQKKKIPDKDRMSCQPSVKNTFFRTKEREILKDFVPFLGEDIKVEDLGEYHPGHGDCLHWTQPGVSDLYAAELADIALAMIPN